MSWLNKKEPVATDRDDLMQAYKEGRKDERNRTDPAVADAAHADVIDAKELYERGRRDERARRRGSPIATVLVLAVAIAGGAMIYLAVHEGSFGRAGQKIDSNISTVTEKAQAPVRQAADKAGSALQSAGESLKHNAGSGG